MERRYKVEVYKVEYKCPECALGWLKSIRSETVTTEGSSSVRYENKCNVCDYSEVSDKIYPRTEYEAADIDSFEPLKDVTESKKELPMEEVDRDRTIMTALERVINAYSQETVAGDTPDFIVAEFLLDSLKALGKAVTTRERWYGRDEKPVVHKPKSINN